jgi:hypothetical protein
MVMAYFVVLLRNLASGPEKTTKNLSNDNCYRPDISVRHLPYSTAAAHWTATFGNISGVQMDHVSSVAFFSGHQYFWTRGQFSASFCFQSYAFGLSFFPSTLFVFPFIYSSSIIRLSLHCRDILFLLKIFDNGWDRFNTSTI